LLARLAGHQVPSRVWGGIVVALTGVLLLTGIEFTVYTQALAGDALALLGGMFSAGYVTAGAELRRTVSTATYTTLCFWVCAILLLATCLPGRQPLTGYSGRDWAMLLALTIGPQLLGHSLFNSLLRTSSPTVISMVLLFEVPVGALIAAFWLGQTPPAAALPAVLLLLVGIGIVVGTRTPAQEPS